jgi:hypothetical protein
MIAALTAAYLWAASTWLAVPWLPSSASFDRRRSTVLVLVGKEKKTEAAGVSLCLSRETGILAIVFLLAVKDELDGKMSSYFLRLQTSHYIYTQIKIIRDIHLSYKLQPNIDFYL